jgi:hypothetical protein
MPISKKEALQACIKGWKEAAALKIEELHHIFSVHSLKQRISLSEFHPSGCPLCAYTANGKDVANCAICPLIKFWQYRGKDKEPSQSLTYPCDQNPESPFYKIVYLFIETEFANKENHYKKFVQYCNEIVTAAEAALAKLENRTGRIMDSSNRRELGSGFSYGGDIEIKDIKVGDFVHLPGTPACGQTEGIVKKINPKNIKLDIGMDGRFGEMIVNIIKDRFIEAYILRDKIVHIVKE